jgi:uncharacterized protein
MKLPLKPIDSGIHLYIRLTPKASSNKIGSVCLDSAGQPWLKVYVTAVPESGKANEALLRLLAKTWKLAKSQCEIISGAMDRYKMIRITGITVEELASLLRKPL